MATLNPVPIQRYAITAPELINELAGLLHDNKLILFAGSGVSRDSGVPTWEGFLEGFVSFCQQLQTALPPESRFEREIQVALDMFGKNHDNIPAMVQSITVLRKRLVDVAEQYTRLKIYTAYENWLRGQLAFKTPNDNHRAIVQTAFAQILTVNYDVLLENAAQDNGFFGLALRSYTYEDADHIAAALYREQTSIIHMHGSINSPNITNDLILTLDDYARLKWSYPGMALMIRNMFTSYSILMVGYGGADQNIEEVFEEINHALQFSKGEEGLPQYYLTVPHDKVNDIVEQYRGLRRTNVIVYDTYLQVTQFLQQLSRVAPRPLETT